MQLYQLISSYLTFERKSTQGITYIQKTLSTYPGQTPTCQFCNHTAHYGKPCAKAAKDNEFTTAHTDKQPSNTKTQTAGQTIIIDKSKPTSSTSSEGITKNDDGYTKVTQKPKKYQKTTISENENNNYSSDSDMDVHESEGEGRQNNQQAANGKGNNVNNTSPPRKITRNNCQHNLKVGIDTRKVLYQQEKLFESITTQTDCNLQIAADIKKFNSIVDLFENVELQLKESVANVNINTSSQVANAVSALSQAIDSNSFNKADELVTLKNHITSLFNISMGSTKKHIEEYVNDLTADLTRELKKICSEVQNLSTHTIDMAAHCNEHYLSESRPTREVLDEVKIITNSVGSDILKEVQSLAGSINTLDSSIRDACLPPAGPSLMDELNAQSTKSGDSGHRSTAEATEGWRFLGSKKVWRSDWTEYDTRNQHRIQQQKMKDRAMARRKANKKQLHRISRSSYYNYNLNDNNNSNNNSNNNRNNNRNNNSSNNRNNNNNTQCGRPTAGNSLPRDKDLLAAARVQFSRPPFENQRGIR
ncbi:integrator complex subunit 1 homolog [Topomyia yanbarensis]|uniref:integrator complex subunit 1 homolog n=1 Tax=Topomyia yanbarensis TaxID=2498891 RepID=UPI00273AFE4B|nr:integrator complex subunit 1 homolog [Topomyia yanbarensis]